MVPSASLNPNREGEPDSRYRHYRIRIYPIRIATSPSTDSTEEGAGVVPSTSISLVDLPSRRLTATAFRCFSTVRNGLTKPHS